MQKENKSLSFCGAFFGGIVGAIPTVLCYIYFGVVWIVLPVIIPFLTKSFYHKFTGENKKRSYIYVISIPIVVLIISFFLVIPFYFLSSNGYSLNMKSIEFILGYEGIGNTIISNFTGSLILTVVVSLLYVQFLKRKNTKRINVKLKTKK
jgi:hypothetical protein